MNIAEYTDSLKNIIPDSNLRDRILGLTVCMLHDLKQSIYVVTAVDISDTSDGKARVLAAFKCKSEAEAYVRNDIEAYVDDGADMGIICDFDKMGAHTEDYSYGCEWNIECVEVK